MNRQLQDEILGYFRSKKNPTFTEAELLEKLEYENDFFQVTALSRDDFAQAAFDKQSIPDHEMVEFAEQIMKDITETFWTSVYEIGKYNLRKITCTKCNTSDDINYSGNGKYYCYSCDHTFMPECFEDTYVDTM